MRYLMTFSYDGTNFYGYQKQPNRRTVQQEIENILSKINNQKIIIHSSGRTDAKVHALNQKAHFDLTKQVNEIQLKKSMNKMLSNDIYIKDIKKVNNNFHARFDVKKKIYIYKINIGEYNPFDRNYIYQYNNKLNIDNMIIASNYLIGKHNFRSFTKVTEEKDFIREIYDIKITKSKNIITLKFSGNGFLRYMVRNIVGTLLAVGEEKIQPINVKKILNQKDRTKAFKTINPEGLYLYNVYY